MHYSSVKVVRKDAKTSRQIISTLLTLAKRNVRIRYHKSFLGFFWSLLNPLIFFSIFVFLFNRVFSAIENYPLFVLVGVLYWNFFSNTTSQMMGAILNSANLLKSLPIPVIVYPIAVALASLFNFGMSFIPFTLFFIVLGGTIKLSILYVIPLTALFTAATWGWSLILSTLNVYFRDTEMLWTNLTPALLYLTPVAYPSTMVPSSYRWFLECNPLYFFIESLRTILYHNSAPSFLLWGKVVSITVIFCSVGYLVFKKLEIGFISTL
ncbi:MAG: ABC transporter permease [Cyanobacteria bacterium P01_G01_bin.54]